MKIKYSSQLAKEAFNLKMNISDLYYIHNNNKKNLSAGDKELMLNIIRNMIKTHKSMIKKLIMTGEYIGNIKDIKYK